MNPQRFSADTSSLKLGEKKNGRGSGAGGIGAGFFFSCPSRGDNNQYNQKSNLQENRPRGGGELRIDRREGKETKKIGKGDEGPAYFGVD